MVIGYMSKNALLFPIVPTLGDKFPDMNLQLVKLDWMASSHELGDVL